MDKAKEYTSEDHDEGGLFPEECCVSSSSEIISQEGIRNMRNKKKEDGTQVLDLIFLFSCQFDVYRRSHAINFLEGKMEAGRRLIPYSLCNTCYG